MFKRIRPFLFLRLYHSQVAVIALSEENFWAACLDVTALTVWYSTRFLFKVIKLVLPFKLAQDAIAGAVSMGAPCQAALFKSSPNK